MRLRLSYRHSTLSSLMLAFIFQPVSIAASWTLSALETSSNEDYLRLRAHPAPPLLPPYDRPAATPHPECPVFPLGDLNLGECRFRSYSPVILSDVCLYLLKIRLSNLWNCSSDSSDDSHSMVCPDTFWVFSPPHPSSCRSYVPFGAAFLEWTLVSMITK